jgi:N-acetylmuramoyl-L-alanine amidase
MGGMRDIMIARRALLALAAASVAAVLPAGLADAQRASGRRNPAARKQRRTIVLDPGHGGVDPGAISPRGIHEKTIALATASELARQLDRSGRYRAVLTRRSDVFVPLRERVARARAQRADVFLSIHADALPNTAMRGLSVYTLSEQASDRETAALAARENRDDFVTGLKLSRQTPEIGAILLDLARRQTSNQSLALARAIVEALRQAVPLLDKPHRSAGFTVLTAPDIPSALVELGCLSNPRDERLLQQTAHQRRLASGLLRAIDDYFAGPVAA